MNDGGKMKKGRAAALSRAVDLCQALSVPLLHCRPAPMTHRSGSCGAREIRYRRGRSNSENNRSDSALRTRSVRR